MGFNVNVPWKQNGMGDREYFLVWDSILLPIIRDFKPDVCLVSAGFDSAIGDRLGDCCVSPYGFSVLTKKLMDVNAKMLLVLEGGYNNTSTAKCAVACLETLLNDTVIENPLNSVIESIEDVRSVLLPYWSCLGKDANSNPDEVTSLKQENARQATRILELEAKLKRVQENPSQASRVLELEAKLQEIQKNSKL